MNKLKKMIALILAALIFTSLVACGEQGKGGEDNTAAEQITEETTVGEGEKSEETDEQADETTESIEFDYEEEDGKVVWTLGPVTFVYYHDGVNVTGYETHIGYDTEEEAKLAYDAYYASEEDHEEGIEDFSRDGSTIIVRYSAESSEIQTYEELIATSELFKNPESLMDGDIEG